jgi:hypothetical protein
MPTSAAVIAAVRESYERLLLDFPKVQQDVERALTAYKHAMDAQAAHKKELAELADFLEREGASVQEPPAVASSAALSANIQILMRTRDLLSDGKPRPTRQIYEDLLRQGQVFTAMNAVQRLSQLLSGSDWFVSDRTRGWMLAKNEDPAATGSPGATQSATDAEGKEPK